MPDPRRATGCRWGSSDSSRKRVRSAIRHAVGRQQSGAVAGNYSDVVSGTSVAVQGAVDKQTQRIAWTVGDNKDTVGETGVYNLTKDEAPALIHLRKGQDPAVVARPNEAAGTGR